jgi:hypothetical protein
LADIVADAWPESNMSPEFSAGGAGAARPKPPLFFVVAEVPFAIALTDNLRQIPLFQYEVVAAPLAGQEIKIRAPQDLLDFYRAAEAQFLANTSQDIRQLVRLSEPRVECNCHGWVFASGRFGVHEQYVPQILSDHAYQGVSQPRDGDLAVYRNAGQITHLGIVRWDDRGRLRVESKWGPFGVFLHEPDRTPFPGQCTFFRGSRTGHALHLRFASR